MNIAEKNKHVLEHLKNKILLSQSSAFFVILHDFLNESISVSEVITILNRLQRNGAITVTNANKAENDHVTINTKLLSVLSFHKRDLSDLSRNDLGEDHALSLSIKASFLDELSDLSIDSDEIEILTQILAGELPSVFPIKISCPIDRSKLCDIKDEKEWKELQLSFSRGEMKKCKERRHPCIFRFQNQEMVIKLDWNNGESGAEEIDEKNPKE